MPLQQFSSVRITANGAKVEVAGILPRETGGAPHAPQVGISWFLVQGEVVVQGTALADGNWSDSASTTSVSATEGRLEPGEADAAAVSVILRETPETKVPAFEIFTWSEKVEVRAGPAPS